MVEQATDPDARMSFGRLGGEDLPTLAIPARDDHAQATKLGAPVYDRLGYRDFGATHMWERRKSG